MVNMAKLIIMTKITREKDMTYASLEAKLARAQEVVVDAKNEVAKLEKALKDQNSKVLVDGALAMISGSGINIYQDAEMSSHVFLYGEEMDELCKWWQEKTS